MHELPHRVRVRLSTQLADVPPSLVAALRRSRLVVSFRISWDCRSVVVEHVASTAAIVRLLQAGVCPDAASPADEPVTLAPAREAEHRRHAERQQFWCSAIGLALVFVPGPPKPALVLARMALGIALDLVQKRAERFAPRPPAAKCLDLLAWGASILRAEHRLHELISSLLRKRLEGALVPRVQLGFGAAVVAPH